jgi:cold shock CspA family protein/ribosome-associated translation inhibitor RaiA
MAFFGETIKNKGMETPLRISLRNMGPSEALEYDIRQRVARLEHFYDRIVGCHVLVERPHRRHHQGELFHVTIDLTVPGEEIIVRRDPAERHAHEDVQVALRDAFDAARRRIEDFVRRRHPHQMKFHEHTPTARVAELFPGDGYGFLEADDGHRIYFHRNSVLHGAFNRLEIGTSVHFAEEMGDKGPQASTVRVR